MNYQVILLAAGQGKRMGAGKNKLLLQLDGQPIIVHTLKVFLDDPNCTNIILVINPNEREIFHSILRETHKQDNIMLAYGGKERQHSVYNGLKKIKSDEVILVHDGARPFIEKETIQQLVKTAAKEGAAIVAVPVKDTIKRVLNEHVVETVERTSLWQVQTPQAFHVSLLKKAHEQAFADNFVGTDDASLVERLDDHSISIVEGTYDNIKLTTKEDLYFAKAIIDKRTNENEKKNRV